MVAIRAIRGGAGFKGSFVWQLMRNAGINYVWLKMTG
jgi:hypothetical protein